jgi:hypothetical protein
MPEAVTQDALLLGRLARIEQLVLRLEELTRPKPQRPTLQLVKDDANNA